jgi:hypothetical protein
MGLRRRVRAWREEVYLGMRALSRRLWGLLTSISNLLPTDLYSGRQISEGETDHGVLQDAS